MDDQLTLDDAPRERHLRSVSAAEAAGAIRTPEQVREYHRSINQDFQRFHAANPQVYDKLVELAETAQHTGHRIGIKMLWEVMRWDLTVKTQPGPDFKLNNNYTSRYARMIQLRRPDLAAMFETRVLRAP